MPRLTNSDYLAKRHILEDEWNSYSGGVFAELYLFEQRDLHRFFAPTVDLYDDDAIVYRKKVTSEEPSLPSQAGRAYAHFGKHLVAARLRRKRIAEAARVAAEDPKPKEKKRVTWRKGQHRVSLAPLVRPERDAYSLAQVLIQVTKLQESGEWPRKPRSRVRT